MIGDPKDVGGYVTQDKFLVGRSMTDLEAILGFRAGRLARGATFAKLVALPSLDQFDLAAYSMTAQHRYATPSGLDIDKLRSLARARWSLSGLDRLVKVFATIPHDPSMPDDDQYPPGSGAPQWKLKVRLPGIVVAETRTASDVYRPAL